MPCLYWCALETALAKFLSPPRSRDDPARARAAQIDHPLRGELARPLSDAETTALGASSWSGTLASEAHDVCGRRGYHVHATVARDASHADALYARCALVRLALHGLPDAMREHALGRSRTTTSTRPCDAAPAGRATRRNGRARDGEDECAAARSDCAAAHRLASGLAQMIHEQDAAEDSGDDEYYEGGYGYAYGEEEVAP